MNSTYKVLPGTFAKALACISAACKLTRETGIIHLGAKSGDGNYYIYSTGQAAR